MQQICTTTCLLIKHCDIIIFSYYKDRPFLINLKEIDFSEDYKTDFVIANTFLSSLNKNI